VSLLLPVQAQMIDVVPEDGQPARSSIAEYVKTTFGYSYSFRWPALGITFAYVVLLRILICVALKVRHRQ
jgi:ABC-type multidrug transport system permease subunit